MSNITVCPTCGQSVSLKRLEAIEKDKLDAQRLASPEVADDLTKPWTRENFLKNQRNSRLNGGL